MLMPKIRQCHTYHDRLGDRNVMLSELGIDEVLLDIVTHSG